MRARSIAAVTLALGLATVATGCEPAAGTLANRTFVSVSVTDGGAAKPLVPGTTIRLTFGSTDLGASAGCNQIGGTYRVEGGRLVFEGVAMTEMGCDPARHAQDEWLVAFLASRPTIRLAANDLFLEGGSTSIQLLDREVAEPDLNLVGPTWTVESIITGEAVSSVPQGATATLVFKADGTVDVNPGCNRGSGSWKLEGAGLRITQVGLTKMACQGPGGDLEAAVLQVLATETLAATIESNQLTLTAGGAGLQLRGS